MSNYRLAERYAKALHQLSLELNKSDELRDDIYLLHTALKGNRDLELMLKSPIVNAGSKKNAIHAIFSGKIDEMTLKFLNLLIAKGREIYIKDVTEAYFKIDFIHREITPVVLTSAVKVSKEIEEKVISILKESKVVKNVNLTTKVNSDIIGGFVLSFEDKLFDASVLRKLELLQKQFEENIYEKKF
ncbi:MAG: ATP synthase F1 subunit delta [Chitinophagaceae bacterium]|nr:MAG: ATP synthase F1 subunit delta [Chitinophagaceae bacterium]